MEFDKRKANAVRAAKAALTKVQKELAEIDDLCELCQEAEDDYCGLCVTAIHQDALELEENRLETMTGNVKEEEDE